MNHYLLDLPAVVSFSGGRTSAYLLRKVLDAFGGQPDDLVISFQNTGLEHGETLDFIHRCELAWGCRITWLEYDLDDDGLPTHRIVNHATAARSGEPFTKMIDKKQYLPNPIARICTANLKMRALKSYISTLPAFSGGHTNAVGLRADEPRRVLRLKSHDKGVEVVCPLYHDGVTREAVDAWWETQPFNLNLPLGGNMAGNCVGCFLKGRQKLELLMHEMPEHFTWWIKAEQTPLSSNPDGGRFQNNRPSYQDMADTVSQQGLLFTPSEMIDDDTIPCHCTD
jgi:hypothetical protein